MPKKKQIKQKLPTKPEVKIEVEAEVVTIPTVAQKEKAASKKQIVLDMLKDGVTIKQIMDVTGWQKHTVFGTLANMKKKLNLNLTNTKESEGDRVYKIQ